LTILKILVQKGGLLSSKRIEGGGLERWIAEVDERGGLREVD
jgi:hypothetical protein